MTTSVLRPNATTYSVTSTFTGGATWQAVTSDDSDASYVVQTVAQVEDLQAILELGTVAMAAGSVTDKIRVRARARADSTTAGIRVSVHKADGTKLAEVSASLTTTITTSTGAYTPVVLTQAEVDGLQLQVWADDDFGKPRFIELYVDLVYATLPTTTILFPTGTPTITTSALTTIYRHASDGGGYPMAWSQVKVFTAAVIGGGGFNPDTSTALYDSGSIPGGSNGIHLTGPLDEGTSHGVYVRTASVVNGSKHWANWDSETFTVDVTAPSVTSITAAPSASSITVTVNRNTGGAAWDHVTVERSADAGATWSFVRGATYDTASGNTYTVTDYEAPNGTSVVYRARGSLTTQVGAWSANSTATSWSSAAIWLKSITTVSSSQIVTLQAIPDYSISETQTQTYAIQTESTAAATSLETLLGPPRRVGIFHVLGATYPVTVSDAGSTLLLQYPPSHGLTDRYLTVTGYSQGFIATNGQQTIANISLRLFNVETVTVARPADTASS